jgi:hypothetical protein
MVVVVVVVVVVAVVVVVVALVVVVVTGNHIGDAGCGALAAALRCNATLAKLHVGGAWTGRSLHQSICLLLTCRDEIPLYRLNVSLRLQTTASVTQGVLPSPALCATTAASRHWTSSVSLCPSRVCLRWCFDHHRVSRDHVSLLRRRRRVHCSEQHRRRWLWRHRARTAQEHEPHDAACAE